MTSSHIEHRCLTREIDDVPVHFQFIRLPNQIFVWIGTGTPKLESLCASMPTRLDSLPSTTALLSGSLTTDSFPVAQRLVMKTGIPVVLSFNIPSNADTLRIEAEKIALQELQHWNDTS